MDWRYGRKGLEAFKEMINATMKCKYAKSYYDYEKKDVSSWTYGIRSKSELDITTSLDALDHILNDVVIESDGKGLWWQAGIMIRRTLQPQPAVGHLQRIHG